jgi:hypothetical protein
MRKVGCCCFPCLHSYSQIPCPCCCQHSGVCIHMLLRLQMHACHLRIVSIAVMMLRMSTGTGGGRGGGSGARCQGSGSYAGPGLPRRVRAMTVKAVRSSASQGVKAGLAEAPGHMRGEAAKLSTGCVDHLPQFRVWLSYLWGWWTYLPKQSCRSSSLHDENGDMSRSEFVGTCWSRAAAAVHTRCWQAPAHSCSRGQQQGRQLALAAALHHGSLLSAPSIRSSWQKRRSAPPKQHARLKRRCAPLDVTVDACESGTASAMLELMVAWHTT